MKDEPWHVPVSCRQEKGAHLPAVDCAVTAATASAFWLQDGLSSKNVKGITPPCDSALDGLCMALTQGLTPAVAAAAALLVLR